MTDLRPSVLALLEQHMARMNAESALRRALLATGGGSMLTADRIPRVLDELQAGIRMFVPRHAQDELVRAIRALGKAPRHSERPAANTRQLAVATEDDVLHARAAARRLAQQISSSRFEIQKIATAVSELARNIVMYASGGFIELSVETMPRSKLVVVARDEGPGIGNLDEIFSGNYRSRTGLGKGLLGVKRLANEFDITTGPSGTRIYTEFLV